jgi:hypothetical protein
MAPEELARSHEISGEKWSATVRAEPDKDGEPKVTFSFRGMGLKQLNLDYIHDDDDKETAGLQIQSS